MRKRFTASAVLSAALVLAALTPAHADELEADPGGLPVPKLAVAPNFTPSSTGSASATIPATVDLTRWAVQPGDQGANEACAAWGIGYTMMGWYAKKYGYANTQFAPMYLYSQTHLTSAADGGGSYSKDNYKVLETQGIAPQSAWPGDTNNFQLTPDANAKAAAAPFQSSTYHTLFASTNPQGNVGDGTKTVIEAALAAGYPVGLGIPIYDALGSLNAQDYTLNLGDPGAESNYAGGHYVVALGYDADGVIVENSWGTSWGLNGFAKLGWDFIAKHAIEGEYIDGIFANIPSGRYKAPTDDMLLETTTVAPTSLKIHWYEPSNTGTTKLTSYTLKIVGGTTNSTKTYAAGSAGYSLTSSSLLANTAYTYTMTATNTLGLSSSTQAVFHTSASGTVVGAVTPRAATYATNLTPNENDISDPTPAATPTPTTSAEPTASPSATPSAAPAASPSTSTPTAEPSVTPSLTPSAEPTVTPSPAASEPVVTVVPSAIPSATPTPEVTVTLPAVPEPTVAPSVEPSATASIPAVTPTVEPSATPTPEVTVTAPITPEPSAPVTPTPVPVTELPPPLVVTPTPIASVPEPVVAPPAPTLPEPSLPVAPPVTVVSTGPVLTLTNPPVAPQPIASTAPIVTPSPVVSAPAPVTSAPVAPVTAPSQAPVPPSSQPVEPPVVTPAPTPAAQQIMLPKSLLKAGKGTIALSFGKSLLKAKAKSYALTVKKGRKLVQAHTYKVKTTALTVKHLKRKTKYTVQLRVKPAGMRTLVKNYVVKTR